MPQGKKKTGKKTYRLKETISKSKKKTETPIIRLFFFGILQSVIMMASCLNSFLLEYCAPAQKASWNFKQEKCAKRG